jgi:uncharacterized membrane protein YhaH (DUF805 family)
MEWYLTVLRKYADFTGRARRKELWMFALINFLITIPIAIVDMIFGLYLGSGDNKVGILELIYAIAMILPNLAVGVRRLHDTGRSGWSMFIILIPFVGAILLLVWYCQDSQFGDNQYGPYPKAELAY